MSERDALAAAILLFSTLRAIEFTEREDSTLRDRALDRAEILCPGLSSMATAYESVVLGD